MTDDIPTTKGLRHGANVDINTPEGLKFATESGLIWKTRFANKGLNAIQDGLVNLADCKNIPDEVVNLLTAAK